MTEKQLLEQILTAQVLLLSKAINAEKEEKGTHRFGGDYSREAAKLIQEKQPEVLRLLSDIR